VQERPELLADGFVSRHARTWDMKLLGADRARIVCDQKFNKIGITLRSVSFLSFSGMGIYLRLAWGWGGCLRSHLWTPKKCWDSRRDWLTLACCHVAAGL
jgi:hypothetical protein